MQMTIKAMLEPNLNLSMLLSQHADTMMPMYEIFRTPLSCYGNLLYVKERLDIYCSLLKRSLRFSYGQHDIEWGSPTALHVTMMNMKDTADMEHSLDSADHSVCVFNEGDDTVFGSDYERHFY